jgi:tripartite-type tricarboxylate transporter receptor subunit TctC
MADIIVYPHVRAGKLKLLAIAADQRHPDFPDTPTMNEAGLPGASIPNFYGIYGPAGSPAEVSDKVNAAVATVATQPEMIKQSLERGVVLRLMSPAETGDALAKSLEINRGLVARAGIKIE